VVELVRRLDGAGYLQAAARLAALAKIPAPSPFEPFQEEPRPFKPYRRRQQLDPHHPFLTAKGIRPETARSREVGAWYGRGMLDGCVAVRLHDPDGAPPGYAGRRLAPGDRGKRVFPPRLPKSRLLYGLHRVRDHPPDSLVLVECPWGVLRLAQVGVPAVALLGVHLSVSHRHLLAGVPRVAVMLDGDPAGRRATTRICSELGAEPILLPSGHDPDDLSDDALVRVLRGVLPS